MASQTMVKEMQQAQSNLADTCLEQIADINVALRTQPEGAEKDSLREKRRQLIEEFRQFQEDKIVIIGAKNAEDLETINAVSKDVQEFIRHTKKVIKTIKVVTALIVFIGACMAKNPKTIADAAAALYKAINEKIDAEAKKGANAAVTMNPIKPPAHIESLLVSLKKPSAKAKAKVAPKRKQ
ncbi:hypothetical protein [Pseudomonas kilonensis]|uniref:Uncharacterized protein n=1 Tax=Pseudomonas kilonensis TaxID=132476 RepID=A0ABY0ZIM6_9PSED|nr:hypothetical protein [Pseudomonas kilonensis]SEE76118.1 hypothetical protein SAMN04490188_5583 [Pseudomonas kilonensis]